MLTQTVLEAYLAIPMPSYELLNPDDEETVGTWIPPLMSWSSCPELSRLHSGVLVSLQRSAS